MWFALLELGEARHDPRPLKGCFPDIKAQLLQERAASCHPSCWPGEMAVPGVFRECCLLLADGLSFLMRQKLQGSICRNGGAVFDGQSLPPATLWFEVCSHGADTSSGAGDLRRILGSERVQVVSAQWVFVCASEGRLLDPASHPIFQPLRCRIPFPPLSSIRCTASMYTELERKCVKNMVGILGASYTDKLLRSHNLLVCKYACGPKYETARSWGIPCVTQEWVFACVASGRLVPYEDFHPPAPEPGAALSTQCGSQQLKAASSEPATSRNAGSFIQSLHEAGPVMPAAVPRAAENPPVSQDRARSSITSTFPHQASHDRLTVRHSTSESFPAQPAHCSDEVGSCFQPLAPGRKRPWSSQLGSHDGPAASPAAGPSSGPDVAPVHAQAGHPGSTSDHHLAATSRLQPSTSQAAVRPFYSDDPSSKVNVSAPHSEPSGSFNAAKGSAQNGTYGRGEGLQALDVNASLSTGRQREASCREGNRQGVDEENGARMQPASSEGVIPATAARDQIQPPTNVVARMQQVPAPPEGPALSRDRRDGSRETKNLDAGPSHGAEKGATERGLQQSDAGGENSAKVIAAIEKIIAKAARLDGQDTSASSKGVTPPEAAADGGDGGREACFPTEFKVPPPLKAGLSSTSFGFGGSFSLTGMRPGTVEEGGESAAQDSEDMVALSQAVGYQDENVRLEQLLQEVRQQHRGKQTPAR